MRPPQLQTLTLLLLQAIQFPSTSSALKLTFVPPSTIPSQYLSTSTSASLISAGHHHHSPQSHLQTAPIQRSPSNGFTFRNLTTGSFLLQVHSPEWAFAPLRVDVRPSRVPATSSGDDTIKKTKTGSIDAGIRGGVDVLVHRTFLGNSWDERGEFKGGYVARKEGGDVGVGLNNEVTSGGETAGGKSHEGSGEREKEVKIVLDVLGRKEYYSAREGFSPLSLFKNPMILLALVSLVLVFGMPYMIDNMDPEMRAEFEEQQRKGGALGLLGGGGGGGGSSTTKEDGSGGSGSKEGEEGGGMGTSAVNALQGFDLAGWMAGQTKTASSSTSTSGATGGGSKSSKDTSSSSQLEGNKKGQTSGGQTQSGKARRRG